MKYSLVLCLAFAPLVSLTGWTIVGLFRGGDATGAMSPSDLKAAATLAADAKSRVDADLPIIQQFEEADLFSTQSLRLPTPQNEDLKAVEEAWQRSEKSRQLVVTFLPHRSPTEPAHNLAQAEQELRQLEGFLNANATAFHSSLRSTDDFFRRLSRRVEQLKADVQRFKREDEIAKALAGAKDDLAGRRFQSCLLALEREPLANAGETTIRKEIDALRKRARYLEAWSRIDGTLTEGLNNHEKRRAVEIFLQEFPDPPSAVDATQHQQLQRRLVQLKVQVAIDDLGNATDLLALLKQATLIVQSSSVEQPDKERTRTLVKRWLTSHIAATPKFPDSLLGKQEAVTKTEKRLIGIFFLPEGSEQYRFWKTAANRIQRPRAPDDQIGKGGFLEPPGIPRYVQWAERHMAATERLQREISLQAGWETFARECEKMNEELLAYRQRWGVEEEPDLSCRGWTFDAQTRLARDVAERWQEVQRVVGE